MYNKKLNYLDIQEQSVLQRIILMARRYDYLCRETKNCQGCELELLCYHAKSFGNELTDGKLIDRIMNTTDMAKLEAHARYIDKIFRDREIRDSKK